MDYQKLIKRIKENEGFSPKPYKDQLGFLTTGYGHLILQSEKHLIKKKITKEELKKIFNKDFTKAVKDYKKFLKQNASSINEEELLIEMVFQMGVKKVLGFNNLLGNMRKKNNYLVCFEMMNSLWYKQTPNRVKKLIITFLKK